jgi:hypothetical protein
MTHGIRDEFSYTRRVEKGVQTPDETLRSRRGSCLDLAVLMMEASRSLGIASRFVSGYIYSPDHSGLAGGGATHSWMQAYLPGAGWIDFDPANSIIGNRNLIRVADAWAPEYVLPLWGHLLWSAGSVSRDGRERKRDRSRRVTHDSAAFEASSALIWDFHFGRPRWARLYTKVRRVRQRISRPTHGQAARACDDVIDRGVSPPPRRRFRNTPPLYRSLAPPGPNARLRRRGPTDLARPLSSTRAARL